MLAAANQNLPSVLQDITPTVDHYGYLAVLALVFVEDFGVPVPGETVLIVGAVEAGGGRLNIALVVLFAFCAAVFGDNVGFAVGRLGGRRVVERYGRYVLVTPARLDKATGFFDRHGGKVITIARFVEGLRQTNGIIAGTTGMRWRRFLVFNAIGAALWVLVWSSLGYFSGSHLDAIYGNVTHYDKYVAIGLGALLVAYVVRHVMRTRRKVVTTRTTGMERRPPRSERGTSGSTEQS